MPLLDVSEILSDPDFMTAMVCERNLQTVGTNGLATETTRNYKFTGVVTSDSGSILDRIDSGQRIKGSIVIHTRFVLTAGSGSEGSDVVQWNGRRYTVQNVNDYSQYGRGFVAAYCDLIPLSG